MVAEPAAKKAKTVGGQLPPLMSFFKKRGGAAPSAAAAAATPVARRERVEGTGFEDCADCGKVAAYKIGWRMMHVCEKDVC